MQDRPAGRLSTRLAVSLGSLIVLTGLVAGTLLAVVDRRERFERAAARQEQDAAEFATRLSADMDERVQDVLLLAELDVLKGRDPTVRARSLERLAATDEAYAWVGVTDDQGVVEAASPDGLLHGVRVAERPWWQAGREGLFVGDLHDALRLADELAGDDVTRPPRFVDISTPLTDATGRTVGVLGAHLYWSWTEDLRAQVRDAHDDDGSELLILDVDGNVLLPPEGVTDVAAVPEPRASIGARGNGVLAWTDGDHVTGWATAEGLGAFEGLGWRVLSRRPAAPIARASLLLGARIIGAALLAALLVAGLAWWRIRRSTGQIREVTAATQRLRAGEDVQIPVLGGTEEVAVLSSALRELTEHLAERHHELEARNRELAEAGRARDHFTMMASHETRTPITIMKGALQTLREHSDRLPMETQVELFEAAWRNLQRLERLMSHMLAAVGVESGAAPFEGAAELVAPGPYLRTMAPEGVVVQGPSRLEVEVDPSLVELPVGNLLDNAGRYGAPPVTVTYGLVDGHLRVSVRDHGPGVPEDFEHRIFQQYAQASEGLRRTAVGAGLGLWLSRELLRAVGGDLCHEPVDGAGARFTALIPVVGSEPDEERAPGSERGSMQLESAGSGTDRADR